MNAFEWTFELRFAVALALGFLVGLEREGAKIDQRHFIFGGVRTHPLISLFGFGCAWLFRIGIPLMLPAGILALGMLVAIGYWTKIKAEHYGATSEISALLTFVTGALALLVDIWASMALGVFNALLLSEKAMLETFVEKLNKAEFLAVLKFLLVTLIILPVLPDQEYTRYHLNPAKVWELVILVSSIGFVGYILSKRLGSGMGLWLSGVLGGIVSSTAVTIAMGRLTQRDQEKMPDALRAAILAGSVMYLRILVLIAVVGPGFVALLWWKMLALAAIGAGLALSIQRGTPLSGSTDGAELQNPFEITPALLFAALFVVVRVATEVVKATLGDAGTLALSLVVGVADVDPFILSVIQMPAAGLVLGTGAVILAMMSNTAAKGVYFALLAPAARRSTLWRYGLWAACHIPLAFIA
jgi:uncharacterized membrane protein (DUF4010 family)